MVKNTFPPDIKIRGNVGRDPQFSGNRANFSLAVFAGKGQGGEKLTQWFNVTAWDEAAELCHNIKKGNRIELHGRLSQWTNDKGETQIGLIADYIIHDEPQPATRPQQQAPKKPTLDIDLDDLL
jgi:hypothetical protein